MSVDHDVRVDTRTIEHLDFEPTLPCEHQDHSDEHPDEPARYVVRDTPCEGCGTSDGTFLLCASAWDYYGQIEMECIDCGYPGSRDEWWTILRVIGAR